MRQLALGIDERPVRPDREARSIGSERTFGVDLARPSDAMPFLIEQSEEVAERLRRHGSLARTVTVKIRSGDYQTLTRSRTLREPTDLTDAVIATARELFGSWATGSFRPLRLVGTSLSNLVEPEAGSQPSLFSPEQDERRRRLDAATDDIRRRFGTGAIGRGDRATGD